MKQEKKIGILGAGVMGEALVSGILRARLVPSSHLVVSDVRRAPLGNLRKKYNVHVASDNAELVSACARVVFCVKPQDLPGVLREVSSVFTPHKLLVSIAAGIPVSFFERCLPEGVPVVRVMPNTPCQVGAGVSVLCGGAHAHPHHLSEAAEIFNCVGTTHLSHEKHLNAVTALSGSGPAYVFLFLESLTDAGVRVGLPRDLAYELALRTTYGSCELLKQTGLSPKELRDRVTSPGGTTIQALSVLEKAGFRGFMMEAVVEAAQRAKELEKEASLQVKS